MICFHHWGSESGSDSARKVLHQNRTRLGGALNSAIDGAIDSVLDSVLDSAIEE
jgi:hypothetical protein